MTEQQNQEQLSLDIGGETGAYVVGEFSLSGKVQSFSQTLDRDENVIVQLVGADGQVIFRTEGWVKAVTVETVPATNAAPRHTRKQHRIKLGERAPVTD